MIHFESMVKAQKVMRVKQLCNNDLLINDVSYIDFHMTHNTYPMIHPCFITRSFMPGNVSITNPLTLFGPLEDNILYTTNIF